MLDVKCRICNVLKSVILALLFNAIAIIAKLQNLVLLQQECKITYFLVHLLGVLGLGVVN
ncbi:hypothetical protein A6S26_33995 [Nostoc sp. ATCC 43529]|nr:hypothetical protein A6S26_33995 [Nostoc sp. ATCC 43529]